MECTLDFLAYDYASTEPRFASDGTIVMEFGKMEEFAIHAAENGHLREYWCAIDRNPGYHCLDLGAASTLGNSFNDTLWDETMNNIVDDADTLAALWDSGNMSSTNLIGQYDTCDGKTVGDGQINVFDIAILIAYHFRDGAYATLDPEPHKVLTGHGRDDISTGYCETTVTRADYLAMYAQNTCDTTNVTSSRRLEEGTGLAQRLIASDVADAWTALQPQVDARLPANSRRWMPLARTHQDVAPNTLGVAYHSITPESSTHTSGAWHTVRTASIALRTQMAFTGLPSQETTLLSNRAFDDTPPDDPTQMEVRFTRFCESAAGGCTVQCAAIETALSARAAMHRNHLELLQSPITRACPYEIHLWVPYESQTDQCVGIDHIMIADGGRGEFARNTACPRNTPPSSSPPGVASPTESPPSPPSPPTESPPSSSDDDNGWVWVVVALGVTLFLCYCFGLAAQDLRRRRECRARTAPVRRLEGIHLGRPQEEHSLHRPSPRASALPRIAAARAPLPARPVRPVTRRPMQPPRSRAVDRPRDVEMTTVRRSSAPAPSRARAPLAPSRAPSRARAPLAPARAPSRARAPLAPARAPPRLDGRRLTPRRSI
jgi:hypothetical protein